MAVFPHFFNPELIAYLVSHVVCLQLIIQSVCFKRTQTYEGDNNCLGYTFFSQGTL